MMGCCQFEINLPPALLPGGIYSTELRMSRHSTVKVQLSSQTGVRFPESTQCASRAIPCKWFLMTSSEPQDTIPFTAAGRLHPKGRFFVLPYSQYTLC